MASFDELTAGFHRIHELARKAKTPDELMAGIRNNPAAAAHYDWVQGIQKKILQRALASEDNWRGSHKRPDRYMVPDGLSHFVSAVPEGEKTPSYLWHQTIQRRPDLPGHLLEHAQIHGVPFVGWAEFTYHPKSTLGPDAEFLPHTQYKVDLGGLRTWAPKPTNKQGERVLVRPVMAGMGPSTNPYQSLWGSDFGHNGRTPSPQTTFLKQHFHGLPNHNHFILEEVPTPADRLLAIEPQQDSAERLFPGFQARGLVLDAGGLRHRGNNTHTFSLAPGYYGMGNDFYHEHSRRNEPMNHDGALAFARYLRSITTIGSDFRAQGVDPDE